jgi:hypothetical protein
MRCVKKEFTALAALFSFEFLFLGLFTNATFAWTNRHIPLLLKAAEHAGDGAVKLESRAKTDVFVEDYSEPTPRFGVFLAAKETVGIHLRNSGVSPLFFKITLAPKVSRYISKSVLNL